MHEFKNDMLIKKVPIAGESQLVNQPGGQERRRPLFCLANQNAGKSLDKRFGNHAIEKTIPSAVKHIIEKNNEEGCSNVTIEQHARSLRLKLQEKDCKRGLIG